MLNSAISYVHLIIKYLQNRFYVFSQKAMCPLEGFLSYVVTSASYVKIWRIRVSKSLNFKVLLNESWARIFLFKWKYCF